MNPIVQARLRASGAGAPAPAPAPSPSPSPAPSGVLYSTLGYVDGDPFIVAPGGSVTIDTDTVKHSAITWNGTVRCVKTRSIRIWGNSISGTGADVEFGTTASPIPSAYTVEIVLDQASPTTTGNTGGGPLVRGFTHVGNTSTGNNGTTNDNGGIARGFIFTNSRVVICGSPQANYRTRLNANWTSGTTITVADPVTVLAGEKIYISPTSYANASNRTQALTVAVDCINSTSITLTAGPTYPRYGKLQYATDVGISETNGPWTDNSSAFFTGSISGATLTITGASGTIGVGQTVKGAGVLPDTYIIATGTGSGGNGTYIVSQSQTVASTALTIVGQKPNAAMDNVIDQRAYVLIPKRNVIFRAATDAETGTNAIGTYGFGAHMMFIGIDGETYLDGIWFKDYGQAGLLGRYGAHWHLPSVNPSTGAILGTFAANKAVVTRSMFDGGHNRAVTLHGVWGAVATNNCSYLAQGHAFFLEDGSEMYNTLRSNWALSTRNPASGLQLKSHDGPNSPSQSVTPGASGFWFSNMNNTFEDNHGVDGDGYGWWNAPSQGLTGVQADMQHGCLGSSAACSIAPFYERLISWNGNTSMSNFVGGGSSNGFPYDNQGNLVAGGWQTTTDGIAAGSFGNPNQILTNIFNARLYQENGSYVNRIAFPHYSGWKVADVRGIGLAGAVQAGSLCDQMLMVGRTNNTQDGVTSSLQQGFASYHGALAFSDISAYNFPAGTPQAGQYNLLQSTALMESWDLYLYPVERWTTVMTNWRFYNTLPMYKTPPPALMSLAEYAPYLGTGNNSTDYTGPGGAFQRRWTLEAANYDANGLLTGTPGSYLIFNQPYCTTGITSTPQASSGPLHSQAIATGTDFYGIYPSNDLSSSPFPDMANRACTFQRVNSSHVDVANAAWVIDAYTAGNGPFTFRHGVIARGQRVRFFDHVHNSVYSSSSPIVFLLSNLFKTTPTDGVEDYFYFGIPWSGGIVNYANTGGGHNVYYAPVSNKAAFDAATTPVYWIDTANGMLWGRVTQNGTGYTTQPQSKCAEFYLSIS